MASNISFLTPSGTTLTGELVTVPGCECLDMVYVQNGFFGSLHELSTGMELMTAKGFTLNEAIADAQAEFAKKRADGMALLKKIHSSQGKHGPAHIQIRNPSPAYNKYAADQKSQRDNLPLAYTEEEREQIMEFIGKLKNAGAPNSIIDMYHLNLAKKADGSRHATIPDLARNVDWNIKQVQRRQYTFNLLPLPKPLLPDNFKPRDLSWSAMLTALRSGYKRKDPTKNIPLGILKTFHLLWAVSGYQNNKYGYTRFTIRAWPHIVRLAIDIEKGRDVVEDIAAIEKSFIEGISEIRNKTQPFFLPADQQGYLKDFPDLKTDYIDHSLAILP